MVAAWALAIMATGAKVAKAIDLSFNFMGMSPSLRVGNSQLNLGCDSYFDGFAIVCKIGFTRNFVARKSAYSGNFITCTPVLCTAKTARQCGFQVLVNVVLLSRMLSVVGKITDCTCS